MDKSNRRTFLKTSLAFGGALALPRFSIAQSGMSPNGKLQIAGIGVGTRWRGSLARDIANDDRVETVALCDVDLDTLNTEGEKFPNARTFQDFREMLAEMDDEIDAFVIATPDHWHTYLSALALSTGKHVFCEKPLTRTIGEMDALAALAKQHPELATQMGNQGHGRYQEWKEDFATVC